MGEEAYRAVPRLTDALRASVELHDSEAWESDPRHQITGVLARISKPLDQTTSALVESLDSAHNSLRWSSVKALGMMAAKPRSVLRVLCDVAQNELDDETIRVEAAYAIAKVGDEADVAPALTALLESNNWWDEGIRRESHRRACASESNRLKRGGRMEPAVLGEGAAASQRRCKRP